MSLVNEMLNDLDRRRGDEGAGDKLDWLTVKTGGDGPRRARRWPIALLLVIAVAALAIVYWWQSPSESAPVAAVAPELAPSQPPAAEQPAPTRKPAPVVLQRIEAGGEPGRAVLTLDFSAQPDYRLERAGDALQLIVANARGEAALPARLPAPLSSIASDERDGALRLRLSLSAPAAASVTRLDDGSRLRLALELPLRDTDEAPVVADAAPAPAQPPQPAAKPAPVTPERAARPLKQARPLTPAQRDRKLAAEARSLLADGQPRQALSLLENFAREAAAPERETGTLLASLYLQQGNTGQAAALLDELLARWPGDSGLRQLRARSLVARGEDAQALAVLEQQRPPLAADPNYYELLAGIAQRLSRFELAEAVYTELVRFDAGTGRWWAGLAVAQDGQGNAGAARANYARALRAGGLSPALEDYARQRLAQ